MGLLPSLDAGLADLGYLCRSVNLKAEPQKWEVFWGELKKFTGFKFILLLPRPEHLVWIEPGRIETRTPLKPFELLLIYIGVADPQAVGYETSVLSQITSLIRQGSPISLDRLTSEPAAPNWTPKTRQGPKSPIYSIELSNNLLHHGNVEALTKIITDFEETFPLLELKLYFEGELVEDLFSLFGWTRLKKGDHLEVQIEGPGFYDLAHLRGLLGRALSPAFQALILPGRRFFI